MNMSWIKEHPLSNDRMKFPELSFSIAIQPYFKDNSAFKLSTRDIIRYTFAQQPKWY